MPKKIGFVVGVVAVPMVWLWGCGGDESSEFVRPKRDAGMESDARVEDSAVDARADAEPSVGDGGNGDADTEDAGASPEPEPCEVSDDTNAFAAPVDFSHEAYFALGTGTTGFGVAYKGLECGDIRAMPVRSSGSFSEPSNVLGSDCYRIEDLALQREGAGWRMAWVDNAGGNGAELQTTLLDEKMAVVAEPVRTRLTENALREERPVLAQVGGKSLLVFAAYDPTSAPGPRDTRLSSLVLDGVAELQEILRADRGHQPARLALMQLSDEAAALAWIDEVRKPGLWLQTLDLAGKPTGAPAQLSTLSSAGATVDLAARGGIEGGAVLYSLAIGGVNNEVRFQRLGPTGAPAGAERKIIGAPLQARDASLARLGGGYAVAYRALPGGPITQPELRLTFISKEGNPQLDSKGNLVTYKVADASAGGGRVTVRLSIDGQLLIGFVDATQTEKRLRLVRKRLDCAL